MGKSELYSNTQNTLMFDKTFRVKIRNTKLLHIEALLLRPGRMEKQFFKTNRLTSKKRWREKDGE